MSDDGDGPADFEDFEDYGSVGADEADGASEGDSDAESEPGDSSGAEGEADEAGARAPDEAPDWTPRGLAAPARPRPAREAGASRALVIVPPDEWVTSDALSLYEAARAVSIRAAQLEKNPRAFVGATPGLDSAAKIAAQELREGRSPLVVYRTVAVDPETGARHVERRPVRDLALPPRFSAGDHKK